MKSQNFGGSFSACVSSSIRRTGGILRRRSGFSLLSHQCGCDSPSSLSSLESVNVFDAYDFLIAGFTMPHRTRPMTALLLFTSLNAVLCATITPVYDFVCFLPYWERRVTLSLPNFSSSFNSSIQQQGFPFMLFISQSIQIRKLENLG